MGLKFYINGTVGAKDGTLVSSGNMMSPIVFDGMYPGASGSQVSKTIFIRADDGETWRDVNMQFKGSTSARFEYSSPSSGFVTGYDSGNPQVILFLPKVTSNNISFVVTAKSLSSESTSPDTSVSLVAWGWQS